MMDEYICEMLDKKTIMEALQAEREYLLSMKMNGAEHILVKHAIEIIDALPVFFTMPS